MNPIPLLLLALLVPSRLPEPPSIRTVPVAKPLPTPRAPILRERFIAHLDSVFASLDGDRDGSVTQAELDAAAARQAVARRAELDLRRRTLFLDLDRNRDGVLSRDEFMAGVAAPETTVPDLAPALKQLDVNGDGRLSVAEYRNPAVARFDALDQNGDGSLSVEEQENLARQ